MMPERDSQSVIVEENQHLWQTNRLPVGCPHCQRTYLVQPSQVNSLCPLCRLGQLAPQPVRLRLTEPESLKPFKLANKELTRIFEDFVSGVWIKPQDFTAENLLKRTIPLFWPLWLVDSDIEGHWQMEAGFNYQVQSSKEVYSGSQWQSKKQIENRIRWEPRLGRVTTHIDNVIVPALEEHANRTQMTGTYAPEEALPFNPDQLGNAMLEIPDLPPEDAWQYAKPQIDKRVAQICTDAARAQHQQNFALKADYPNQNWTQFYLPIYATHYLDDDGHPQILIVNGETGNIRGPRLASQKRGVKIAGIIGGTAVFLLILALISLLLTMVLPPAAVMAGLLGVAGFCLGIIALIPAIWPGQWNRKQQSLQIFHKRNRSNEKDIN